MTNEMVDMIIGFGSSMILIVFILVLWYLCRQIKSDIFTFNSTTNRRSKSSLMSSKNYFKSINHEIIDDEESKCSDNDYIYIFNDRYDRIVEMKKRIEAEENRRNEELLQLETISCARINVILDQVMNNNSIMLMQSSSPTHHSNSYGDHHAYESLPLDAPSRDF